MALLTISYIVLFFWVWLFSLEVVEVLPKFKWINDKRDANFGGSNTAGHQCAIV